MKPTLVQHGAQNAPLEAPGGLRWPPGGPPEAPGSKELSCEAINRPRIVPGGLRGRRKIRWFRPGGLQKSSWIIFQRLEPPRE